MKKFIAQRFFFLKKGLNEKINELKKTEYFSEEEIINYQERKLEKLINHSYKNVPYYRDIFFEYRLTPNDIRTIKDLQKLPILGKEDVQNNVERLKAENIKPEFSSTTSGSTGKPLTIYYDYLNKIIEIALMERFNNNIGYNKGDRQLLFWGGHTNTYVDKIKLFLKQIIYNYKLINTYKMSENILEKIAIELTKSPPKNLRGYTSAIYLLAKKMEVLGLYANIDSISVTAEQLFDYQRKAIENHLGTNIYDQYGCGETNSIAFECSEHKGLHHAFEHSILEIVDDFGNPSETGNVVITNLDNFSMPLIRYKNGDIASLSSKKCSCGRNSILIKKIEGRSYDSIIGLNGKIAHGGFFDDVLLDTGFIRSFNIKNIIIIQTEPDELTIEYDTNDNIPDNVKTNLSKIYQRYLGPMRIVFKKVDKFPLTKSGKRKFVISFEEYKKMKNI
jgi:phenylacetate-CoA ligase